jgi:hypothetical protein
LETVYIETSIVSLLVANPSRDLVTAGHQAVTRQWWGQRRHEYRCVTSDEVLREASLGDKEMSRKRLEELVGLTVFQVGDTERALAQSMLDANVLPPNVMADAIHAAVSSIQRVDILLTWNCRHLANPHIMRGLRKFIAGRGLTLPEICTPIELEGN